MLIFNRVSSDSVKVAARFGSYEVFRGLIHLPRDRTLSLMPHPPVGGRVATDCLLVKLPDDLYIESGGTAALNVQVPVDIGLYLGSSLVAVIPSRPKYALYGPSDLGDLCRYSCLELVESLEPCLKSVLGVSVSNIGKTTVRVSKVVVPTRGVGMYISPTWRPLITSVKLLVHSQTYAEVRTEPSSPPPVEEALKMVVPPVAVTYVMRYGL
ncbi:MAG: DUF432 domain-containing protein [Sulfolobales archaeon]|nr:DUF432 domain-containing protein [Sulfolobales archaeon]MDW8082797.1 DUF432 domain-containing protein [Sulfolobales archaeon]